MSHGKTIQIFFDGGTVTQRESGEFVCLAKGARATGVLSDEGFVILKGSTAALEEAESCPRAARRRREHLISTGVLVAEGSQYRVVKDASFTSPSAAACVVAGNSGNGLVEWKDANNQQLKRYYSNPLD